MTDDLTNNTSTNTKEEDSNMTLEERTAWLRERGVMVETAEERQRQRVVQAMKVADSIDPSSVSAEPIYYVKIPSDASQPLEELSFVPPPHTVGDALVEHLKPAFAPSNNSNNNSSSNSNTVDLELLKQQMTQTTLGSADTPSVSDATLQTVAAEGHVEAFPLVHPHPDNQYTGVTIYLDEVGQLRRLPLNPRASDYCRRAGLVPPPVIHGTVYLGRVRCRPSIQSVSLRLGADTALDAAWLAAAPTQNLAHQQAINQATGRSDVQPTVAGSDGTVAHGNGYTWTQTEAELEVSVPVNGVVSAKSVKVNFRPRTLDVTTTSPTKDDQNAIATPVAVSMRLFERIDIDACTWTLESSATSGDTTSSQTIVVSMEKLEEALWPRLVD